MAIQPFGEGGVSWGAFFNEKSSQSCFISKKKALKAVLVFKTEALKAAALKT